MHFISSVMRLCCQTPFFHSIPHTHTQEKSVNSRTAKGWFK